MKSRDVKKGIFQGTSANQPPTEIDLSSVSRIPRLRTRESSRASQRPKSRSVLIRERFVAFAQRGWSIAIAVATLIAMVLAFVVWVRPILQREKDTTERDRQAAEERAKKISRFASLTELEALALVNKALAARTPAEINATVRYAPLSQQEATDLLVSLAKANGPVKESVWLGSLDSNSMQSDGVELRFSKPPKPLTLGESTSPEASFFADETLSRVAILVPDDQGVWRLDLPAFAQLCVPSWEKFQADKTIESAVVRVLLGRDNYYNGPFSDEKIWQAYSFATDDSGDSFVAYSKRGTAQNRALHLVWRRATRPAVRATLELRRVPGGDLRQFLISRVLAEDWALGDKPMDETVGDDAPAPPRCPPFGRSLGLRSEYLPSCR